MFSYVILTCFYHIRGEANSNTFRRGASGANCEVHGESLTGGGNKLQAEGVYKQARKE